MSNATQGEPSMTAAPVQAGRSISRVEGTDKVTGHARYTADVPVDGVAYAVLVQSEIPHGTVTASSLSTSTDRAVGVPGVLHVLAPLNCPPLQVLPHELTYDLPLERRPSALRPDRAARRSAHGDDRRRLPGERHPCRISL